MSKSIVTASLYGNIVVQVNDILTPELALALADKLKEVAAQALVKSKRKSSNPDIDSATGLLYL